MCNRSIIERSKKTGSNNIEKAKETVDLPENKRWKTGNELGELKWLGSYNLIDTGEFRLAKKDEYHCRGNKIYKNDDGSKVEVRIFKPVQLEDLITDK